MKTCKKCECQKERTDFYNQKRYRDNLDPICKVCRDETSRQYYLDNKEKVDEYKRTWNVINKERLVIRRKAYYQNNKERFKIYYETCRKKKEMNEKN